MRKICVSLSISFAPILSLLPLCRLLASVDRAEDRAIVGLNTVLVPLEGSLSGVDSALRTAALCLACPRGLGAGGSGSQRHHRVRLRVGVFTLSSETLVCPSESLLVGMLLLVSLEGQGFPCSEAV